MLTLHSLLITNTVDRAPRRWALVTGASSGIGEALSREAAARGYDVILTARRRPQLEALARELGESSTRVHIVSCDLGTAAGLDQLCASTADFDVGLACLNAGICLPATTLASQPSAEVEAMLDLNVRANTRLLGHFAGALATSGGGKILIVGSSAGAAPGVPGVAVCAWPTQTGFVRLTDSAPSKQTDTLLSLTTHHSALTTSCPTHARTPRSRCWLQGLHTLARVGCGRRASPA